MRAALSPPRPGRSASEAAASSRDSGALGPGIGTGPGPRTGGRLGRARQILRDSTPAPPLSTSRPSTPRDGFSTARATRRCPCLRGVRPPRFARASSFDERLRHPSAALERLALGQPRVRRSARRPVGVPVPASPFPLAPLILRLNRPPGDEEPRRPSAPRPVPRAPDASPAERDIGAMRACACVRRNISMLSLPSHRMQLNACHLPLVHELKYQRRRAADRHDTNKSGALPLCT